MSNTSLKQIVIELLFVLFLTIAPQSGVCIHCATSIELKLFKGMPPDLCLLTFPIILV